MTNRTELYVHAERYLEALEAESWWARAEVPS